MPRSVLTVGKGGEVVAAAVTSIVLTVLAITKTILTVHADQVGWEATAVPRTPEADDEPTRERGGGAAWA
jgi:hypothetical protein